MFSPSGLESSEGSRSRSGGGLLSTPLLTGLLKLNGWLRDKVCSMDAFIGVVGPTDAMLEVRFGGLIELGASCDSRGLACDAGLGERSPPSALRLGLVSPSQIQGKSRWLFNAGTWYILSMLTLFSSGTTTMLSKSSFPVVNSSLIVSKCWDLLLGSSRPSSSSSVVPPKDRSSRRRLQALGAPDRGFSNLTGLRCMPGDKLPGSEKSSTACGGTVTIDTAIFCSQLLVVVVVVGFTCGFCHQLQRQKQTDAFIFQYDIPRKQCYYTIIISYQPLPIYPSHYSKRCRKRSISTIIAVCTLSPMQYKHVPQTLSLLPAIPRSILYWREAPCCPKPFPLQLLLSSEARLTASNRPNQASHLSTQFYVPWVVFDTALCAAYQCVCINVYKARVPMTHIPVLVINNISDYSYSLLYASLPFSLFLSIALSLSVCQCSVPAHTTAARL